MSSSAASSFDELFWSDSERWPIDAPDFIFLARAVEQIEQRLFNEQLILPPPWDEIENDSESAKIHARHLDYEKEKSARRFKAVDAFVSACRGDRLVCATRSKQGGEFSYINKSIWNTERYSHWFYRCEIDEYSPFDADTEWADTKWMFVRKEGLDNLEASGVSISSQPRSRDFSPYLQLMIDVSEELKISSTNQPTVESLVALFAERWEQLRGKKLSRRLAHSMATLVRNVESQGGRNKARM